MSGRSQGREATLATVRLDAAVSSHRVCCFVNATPLSGLPDPKQRLGRHLCPGSDNRATPLENVRDSWQPAAVGLSPRSRTNLPFDHVPSPLNKHASIRSLCSLKETWTVFADFASKLMFGAISNLSSNTRPQSAGPSAEPGPPQVRERWV